MTVRRKTFTIAEPGESEPMTADDQVCVSGLLEGGAAFSIHYRGGSSCGLVGSLPPSTTRSPGAVPEAV
jgi:hypothetical protein